MSRYRTGDYLIDLDAREIRCAGALVDVEAKVFDLIALLLAHRDRALSKRELNAALWNDRPVTDAALSQQLRKARRALGDDGNAQRVIRTVHGHGLRWVAEVLSEPLAALGVAAVSAESALPEPPVPTAAVAAVTEAAPVTSARRSRYLALAGLVALLVLAATVLLRHPIGATSAAVRVAVLPVDDRTGDAALAWTRTGLMGLMVGLFEQRDRLEVVAARSVQAVDASADPADAATLANLRRALGATHFVASRLRRVGTVYELELRLIASGAAQRRETLHGTAPAPLAVAAVAQVRRWLDLAELPNTDGRGIAGAFLAEAYARGLDAQLHGDHAGARKYFDICLDQDPGLAWPRLGLAIAQGATGELAKSAENAAVAAAAAREHGDDALLIAALRQLGAVAFRRGDLDGAAGYLNTALKDLTANRPLELTELLVAYASIEDERGNFKRSRTQFERALALARDTGNRRGEALVLVNLASLENGAGDAAAATTLLRAGLDAAREAGDAALEGDTLANLGAAEANQGHLLDAIALLKQALAIASRRDDTHLEMLTAVQLIWALAPFNRDTDIDTLARRVAAAAERDDNPYWQAELHWALGARARRHEDWPHALAELGRAGDLYAAQGMTRNLAPVLASVVEAAAAAGATERATAAAAAFRQLAAADPEAWNAWLPLLAAQLRRLDGDAAGARDDLADLLDRAPGAQGAAAQAMLFQLGRWQVASGQFADVLLRAAWKPWMEQHPDAIALRIAALRATGQPVQADAEQARLDRLNQAPELDLSAAITTPPERTSTQIRSAPTPLTPTI